MLRDPQVETIFTFIDTLAAKLDQSQKNNFQRWLIIDRAVWPNSEVAGTYAGEVAFLKSWLTQRIAYLDTQFGQ